MSFWGISLIALEQIWGNFGHCHCQANRQGGWYLCELLRNSKERYNICKACLTPQSDNSLRPLRNLLKHKSSGSYHRKRQKELVTGGSGATNLCIESAASYAFRFGKARFIEENCHYSLLWQFILVALIITCSRLYFSVRAGLKAWVCAKRHLLLVQRFPWLCILWRSKKIWLPYSSIIRTESYLQSLPGTPIIWCVYQNVRHLQNKCSLEFLTCLLKDSPEDSLS